MAGVGEGQKHGVESILSTDLLLRVLDHLSARDLGRAACVCKYWRVAAQADELWKQAFKTEYGHTSDYLLPSPPAFPVFPSPTWHAAFLKATTSPHRPYAATASRFSSALESISEWRVTFSQVPSVRLMYHDRHLEVDHTEYSLHRFCGSIRSTGPQSLCLQFDLPLDTWEFGSSKEYVVVVEGLGRPVGSGRGSSAAKAEWFVALKTDTYETCPTYKEEQRMMQAHKTGLYDHLCEAGRPRSWPSADQQGAVSSTRSVRLLAYLHSQQLLSCYPFPLPHSLAIESPSLQLINEGDLKNTVFCDTGAQIPASLSPILQLLRTPILVYLDFVSVQGDLEGSCWMETVLQPKQPGQHTRNQLYWHSRGPSHTNAGQGLLELADAEAMVDITLINRAGKILLGRAGVEIWCSQDREDPFELQFIPDMWEEDEVHNRGDGTSWSNNIQMCPRSQQNDSNEGAQGAAELEEDEIHLTLTWEATASMTAVSLKDELAAFGNEQRMRDKLLSAALRRQNLNL